MGEKNNHQNNHSEEKTRQSRVFLKEKCKKSRELDWNSFVYFTLSMKKIEESRQNNGERGKNRTRRY